MTRSSRIVALVALLSATPALAQQFELPRLSPFAKAVQTVGLTDITVDYSSPAVRGRKIWGGLVPYGEVWRAGANQATKITFSKDVTVGTTPVPAGSYSVFVVPNKTGAWAFILNKDLTATAQTYKKEADLVRVDVKPVAGPGRERLYYGFPDFANDTATVELEWEKVRLQLPVKLTTSTQVAANIKALEENPQSPFTQAARYQLEQAKDYDAGMKLVDKSISMKEDWFNLWTKAQLLAAKGDKKAALPLAQKADDLGKQNPKRYFFAEEVKKALTTWK